MNPNANMVVPQDPLLEKVIGRLHATRTSARQLIKIDLPPALAAEFSDAVIAKLKPASVLVPLMDRPDGIKVLLTQRASHLRTHAGQISFPGGRRDDVDRDVVDTALREAEEEVGIARHFVQPIGFLDDYPTITGYRVTPVVALVRREAQVSADGGEVSEIIELPLAFVLNPSSYNRKMLTRPDGIEVPIFEIQFGSFRIWGATAGMLNNFCGKMQ